MYTKEVVDIATLHAIIEALQKDIYLHKSQLRNASMDELTGLIKRNEFVSATQESLSSGHQTSVIFIDLNGFKEINDTIGHAAGDSLLVQFANFLREQKNLLGEIGLLVTIARLGGDEFAILMPYMTHEEASRFASDIKEGLTLKPFFIGGESAFLHSAIGVSSTEKGYCTVSEMLMVADKAMYADKADMATRGEITRIVTK